MKRLTLVELTGVVEELLNRAAGELWASAEFSAVSLREYARQEAYGLWWGAFVLALRTDAVSPGGPHGMPDTWRFSCWAKWVLEAAEEIAQRRRGESNTTDCEVRT